MSSSRPDAKSFQALAEPHLDALMRTARRMTRDENDAEDLLQETLLKGFRSIDQFEPESNFRAWIFRILTNTFINEYRRRRRAGPEIELDEGPEPVAPEESPVVEARAGDLGPVLELVDERLRQAVLDLPPPLLDVFGLAVLEDLKYREIAEVLDIPVGTVMSRLFRARAMLKERLLHHAEEEGFLR
ncbi:MAG: sigma-70 family RNA polymerase sigma factor [Planctomycetota bacterium]